MKVGMFDSGLGGLSVLKAFLKKHPNNEYYYYGDTLNMPYGNKTKEELLNLSSHVIDSLIKKDIDIIIIACGTVSSNVADSLKEKYSIPIYTVLDFLKEYISNKESIAVMATKATIESHIFKNFNPSIKEIACPKIVPLIESGQHVDEAIKEYLTSNYNFIVLGCTHYALIKDEINRVCPNARLIDMGEVLADNIDLVPSKHSVDLFFSKDIDINIKKAKNILDTCYNMPGERNDRF